MLDLSVIMECYFLCLPSLSAPGSSSHSLILTPGDHVTQGSAYYRWSEIGGGLLSSSSPKGAGVAGMVSVGLPERGGEGGQQEMELEVVQTITLLVFLTHEVVHSGGVKRNIQAICSKFFFMKKELARGHVN